MPPNPSRPERAARDLIDAASAVAGFKLTRPEYASAANVSGVRSKTQTFSARHDSRTVFASDATYGHLARAGAWTGNNRTAATACRRVLRAAGVPRTEIAGVDVIAEIGQVAERRGPEKVEVERPAVLRKLARARRSIAGLPVWSSYATVGLNRAGEVGILEVHWPEVPSLILKEGGFLKGVIDRGFKPPELPGARAEAIEAGIIHSPAIGFFMDVYAAIRVVYRGHEPTVGRKPTMYLDRHGEPLPLPRDIAPAEGPSTDRKKPRSSPGKRSAARR